MRFIAKKHLAAPDVSARRGRDGGVAAARFHGARANAAGANRCQSSQPLELYLRAARRHDVQVDSSD